MTRQLGQALPDWVAPPRPDGTGMHGKYVELAPLEAQAHSAELFKLVVDHDEIWDYMPMGPFGSAAAFHRWIKGVTASDDPVFYAIRNLDSGKWEGFLSLLRIAPEDGAIEVGYITFAPPLQGTRAATEAIYLLMQWAFGAGYRRFEWKCNALNLPSRRAAQRFGFSYEGVFRHHMVVKGRNRDTAWFAATDGDWPALDAAFTAWLSPANFDAAGRQRERLSDLTRLVRVSDDPALQP